MPQNPLSPFYLLRECRRLLKNLYRSYKDYLLFFGGLLLALGIVAMLVRGFWELLEGLRDQKLGSFDNRITAEVLSWRSPGTDWFFAHITHLGGRFAYILLAVLMFVYLYFRKGNLVFSLQAILVLIVAAGISFWLKDLIDRPRPEAAHHLNIGTQSFPSGHAMSSIAYYGFLIYLCWRIYKNTLKKILLSLLLLFLIISIGLSRVYLQVHYPSDVLSGFAAGGACLLLFITAFAIMRFNQRRKREDLQPDKATAAEPEV